MRSRQCRLFLNSPSPSTKSLETLFKNLKRMAYCCLRVNIRIILGSNLILFLVLQTLPQRGPLCFGAPSTNLSFIFCTIVCVIGFITENFRGRLMYLILWFKVFVFLKNSVRFVTDTIFFCTAAPACYSKNATHLEIAFRVRILSPCPCNYNYK